MKRKRNKLKMNKICLNRKINRIIINKLQGKLKVGHIKYLITCSFKCQMNSSKEIMLAEKF